MRLWWGAEFALKVNLRCFVKTGGCVYPVPKREPGPISLALENIAESLQQARLGP